ncbi:MAG: recombinase family protein [Bryobacteraceae bacterium]|jgi:DNA invertase Pin-like site-specific DNA recombinase
MTKAFAYLRVSGKGRIDGDGFERQRAAAKSYAVAHGLKIVQVFQDRGVSGTKDPTENLASRPAWIAMLSAIAANGVRTIVIEKLGRLARDLMVQEHILADLSRRGITLVSVAEPDLCSDDPTRILPRQIMGAIAEYDRKMVVLKLRAARLRRRINTGRCEGEKPYGQHPERPDEVRALGNNDQASC